MKVEKQKRLSCCLKTQLLRYYRCYFPYSILSWKDRFANI